MNDVNYDDLLHTLRGKVDDSFELVKASVQVLDAYDGDRAYSPQDLDPYDSLSSRFVRCVEIFIKYFYAYEYKMIAMKSVTFRDNLNVMEKLGLVSATPLWMDMRHVRNRMVHDYLPAQTKQMFDDIMGPFFNELMFSKAKIDTCEPHA